MTDEPPQQDLAEFEADSPQSAGTIVLLRGRPIVVDAKVAQAFGVETREVNQAVARNREKFTEAHAFQVSDAERDFLISHSVIPRPGRGGSRTLPHVFTQKGVARLATVIASPQALAATDMIIDLFVEVYQQIAQGHGTVAVNQPSRFLPDLSLREQVQDIRKKLLTAIQDLLATQISPTSKATVADEIGDLAQGALGFVKAHLGAKGIENEKIAAETVHLLEKAREVRDRTRADVAKTQAETERVMLENFEKKLALVERLSTMAEKLEPNAFVVLSQTFVKPALLLQPPPSVSPPADDPAEKDTD